MDESETDLFYNQKWSEIGTEPRVLCLVSNDGDENMNKYVKFPILWKRPGQDFLKDKLTNESESESIIKIRARPRVSVPLVLKQRVIPCIHSICSAGQL